MYEPRIANCIDCKQPFWKKSNRMVRCRECQKARDTERLKAYEERRRQEVREKQTRKKDPHVCTRTKSCAYGATMHNVPYCDYMKIVGHKRPCPVQGCTEYRRKSRKKKQEAVT